jgi:tetratricopeptide (TPR) repeat protein
MTAWLSHVVEIGDAGCCAPSAPRARNDREHLAGNCFVTGCDFSRAERRQKARGFSPCGKWVALFLLIGLLLGQTQSFAQSNSPSKTSKPSANFQQAEILIQQGRLEQAKNALMEELQKDPASVEAYNLLGIVESGEQDFPSALAAFQKALQLAPNSTRTHNNLGNFYATQKKFDLAEKEFRAVLRLSPADREANYNLGVLLVAKKSFAEAIAHFQRVRPADLPASFQLIGAYLQSKRNAEALQLTAQLSAQNKDNVQAHFTLGVLLASAKLYKQAQAELELADALQPGTFEILYNLGQAQLRGGDNGKAELVLNRALKLMPESAETLYLLAQVYTNQSHPLDALDLLVRAHKLAPRNTDIIFQMAQIGISQNYFEDAIPLLEEGLQIDPLRVDLLATLGESYFMAGKADKSIEEFKKLVEIDPSARSYAFLGLPYRYLGRFDEAKPYFQKGLKLDPHNNSCLFNLGVIAEQQGDAAAAEGFFQQILRANPNYPDALLELANIRIAAKKYPEAAELLRKYVAVSKDPSTGYYKLAMVERSLHQSEAAERDMKEFQTLSKNVNSGPLPFEHLFDYLDNRSKLAPGARQQLDLAELAEHIKKHPEQPENLYLLAEAYLKSGDAENAANTIAQLDKISAGDYRTLTGVGVLLARFHLYDDAIRHFQAALQANPGADEASFDLANAYFRKRLYSQALETARQVSEAGRKDEAYLALLGDIYAHLGDSVHAEEIYRDAIARNPDDDQNYLAQALLQLRDNNLAGAKETLSKGQTRVPGSGKLLWGMGVVAVLEGNTAAAAERFERVVDMLPEWPGSYSLLGVFYFQRGQIAKAKEVLGRFRNSSASGSLNIARIEQLLEQTPEGNKAAGEPMTMAERQQLLQLALSLADRTL